MLKRTFWFLGIALFFVFKTNSENYSITQYYNTNEFAQSSIRALAQDAQGFIWIGAENGLARFDGLRFKKINAPKGHTVVNAIKIDKNNRVWVKWHSFPITLYDPEKHEWIKQNLLKNNSPIYIGSEIVINNYDFIYYENISLEAKQSFKNLYEYLNKYNYSVYPHYIKEDYIWISSEKGVIFYNIKTHEYFEHKLDGEHIYAFTAINKKVYFCTTESIYKTNKKDGIQLVYLHNNSDDEINLCINHGTKIIFSIGEAGIKAYDVLTNDVTEYYHKDFGNIDFNTVYKKIYSDQESIWVVLDNHFFEFTEGKANKIRTPPNTPLNISMDSPIIKLKDGSLLLGSNASGLFSVSKVKDKFTTVKPPFEVNHTYRKAVQLHDDLWLTSNIGGISRWNRKTDVWRHYVFKGLKTTQVRAIAKDSQGGIWTGTTDGYLLKYNKTIDDFEVVLSSNQRGYGINTILIDGKNIWFESGGKFQKYNSESQQTAVIPLTLGESADFYIKTLHLSKVKNIIIGTHGQGVIVINQAGEVLHHWKKELTSVDVFSVYEDRYGYIWAGTWGGGLNRIDPNTNQVQVFNSSTDFGEDTVFAVLPGLKGELWLSGYNGLIQFKGCINQKWLCSPVVHHFNQRDGLQGDEFDGNAFALLDTGELYFSGAKGFNLFKPQDFQLYDTLPPLAITDIFIDNEVYQGDTTDIVVEHNHNKIQIEFIAFDYHDPLSNKYQYRIDDVWQDLISPHIEFQKMEAGSYTLELRGSNHDGLWAKKPLSLNIKIKPPFYLSWGAINLYILVLLFTIFTVIRYRERMHRQEKIKLKYLVAQRTEEIFHKKQELKKINIEQNKLYSSISHEIRTPLTILLAPIEGLKEGDKIEKEPLETIKRQANELKYYINDLVNLTNLKSFDEPKFGAHEIIPYLKSLLIDYSHLAQQKSISLRFETNLKETAAVKSYKRSLNIIMNNLMDNAIKHTPKKGLIVICADQVANDIQITIKDSGGGITNVNSEYIYEYGKSDELSWHWLNSLGIGLNTSNEIAKALGGRIKFSNNEIGGTNFSLILPIACNNLTKIKDDTNIIKPIYDFSQEKFDSSKLHEKKPLILAIDDNPEILSLLKQQLSINYHFFGLQTAEQGEEFINTYSPDIVICDVMLPGKSGFDLLQDIKSDVVTDITIMIMLTAMEEEVARLKSLELHADAHISKPYDKSALLSMIKNLLFLQERNVQKANRFLKEIYHTESSNSTNQTIVQKLLSVIKIHYSDQMFKSPQLAKEMNMSISTLQRKLKKDTQLTLGQILYNYRVEKAKELMKDYDSLTEIAYLCGFSSNSHFSTKFQHMNQMTPSEYKKNI